MLCYQDITTFYLPWIMMLIIFLFGGSKQPGNLNVKWSEESDCTDSCCLSYVCISLNDGDR